MGSHGPPAAVGVEFGGQLPPVDPVEGGGEDVPSGLELIAADEEPLVPVHGVQDQPLVRVGKLELLVAL